MSESGPSRTNRCDVSQLDVLRVQLRYPELPSGDQSAVEPPGPIPNPEVKRRSADGSGTTGPVRVGRRQVFAPHQPKAGAGLFFAGGRAHMWVAPCSGYAISSSSSHADIRLRMPEMRKPLRSVPEHE